MLAAYTLAKSGRKVGLLLVIVIIISHCLLAAEHLGATAGPPTLLQNLPVVHAYLRLDLDPSPWGQQVLLLPDYGLEAPSARPRPLQPLKLPDPEPLLVHLAAESAAYWGGLQQLSGASNLLAPQQSLDVVLDPDRDHSGALGFSKLQVCCLVLGLYLVGQGTPTSQHSS